VYFIIHAADLVSIVVSSYKLIKILYNKRNEAYEDHKVIITFFAFLICFIIIVRLAFSYDISNFEWTSILIYSIIELLILLVFSIFKKDEDCFACFNRSN